MVNHRLAFLRHSAAAREARHLVAFIDQDEAERFAKQIVVVDRDINRFDDSFR
jgi:hypothetical protein